jgi:hypothetical protein
VSRFRWHNVYHFGDFHGSEATLLKYYDAHFYIANWGTVRPGLAFPKGCLVEESIQPHLREGKRHERTLSVEDLGNRLLVWWERNDEGVWWETQGDGVIDDLIGLREELMRGDYGALFLGWLSDFCPDDWLDPKQSADVMPPIPAGLDRLSGAQTALIEHFPVDPDALPVAAGLFPAAPQERIPISTAPGSLQAVEMRALLERVAGGDGSRVMSELYRLTFPASPPPAASVMSCNDRAAKAVEVGKARRQRGAIAAAAARKRKEEARREDLAAVLLRADSIWAGLAPLMDQQVASADEQVAAQLKELRDAHEQAGRIDTFKQKLAAYRERYARRPAMLRRIDRL